MVVAGNLSISGTEMTDKPQEMRLEPGDLRCPRQGFRLSVCIFLEMILLSLKGNCHGDRTANKLIEEPEVPKERSIDSAGRVENGPIWYKLACFPFSSPHFPKRFTQLQASVLPFKRHQSCISPHLFLEI